MARAGHGVGLMLEAVAARTPGVSRLFPEWPGFPTPLWLVCHRELRTSRRVRLVFDMLAEELERLAAGAGTDAGLGYIATGRPTPASG
jgi:DNA-binding transcriptional LysR family regulator